MPDTNEFVHGGDSSADHWSLRSAKQIGAADDAIRSSAQQSTKPQASVETSLDARQAKAPGESACSTKNVQSPGVETSLDAARKVRAPQKSPRAGKLPIQFLLCTILSAATAYPQAAGDKGKQIIDRAIAALGGERFLQMNNRVASGRVYSFFHDEMSGSDVARIYTEYLGKASSGGVAVREREVLGKKQDYSYLFLGNQGWDITYRGARPIPDETWERYVRTTRNDILYFLRERSKEPGLHFDYIGSDVYISTHVEVVDITDAQNQTIRVYFDHNTMLPLRESYTWMDPQTRQRNEDITNFDKYRDTGGVMWPFTIERQHNGYKSYQMFAAKVEVNQALPPKIFELPSGAKVLKKVD